MSWQKHTILSCFLCGLFGGWVYTEADRTALGSCPVIGNMKWAAKLEAPISRLEVAVQADYHALPEYPLSDASADYAEIRYAITIESTASDDEILALIDQPDAHGSYYDVFSRPQKLKREVKIAVS